MEFESSRKEAIEKLNHFIEKKEIEITKNAF